MRHAALALHHAPLAKLPTSHHPPPFPPLPPPFIPSLPPLRSIDHANNCLLIVLLPRSQIDQSRRAPNMSSLIASTVHLAATKTLNATAVTAAAGNATANRAVPQGGILEHENPTIYDPKNPIIIFIIQVIA